MDGKVIVSWSSLNMFNKCGYSYWLKYVKRFKPFEIDLTGTVPGTVCHNLTKKFYDSGAKDWDIFVKDFSHKFDSEIAKSYVVLSKEAFASSVDEARELILGWLNNLVELLHENNLVQPFYISEGRFGSFEEPFWIEDIGLMGGWDLLCGESSVSPLTLVDFKASESTYHLDKRQLLFYAFGIWKKFGFNINRIGFILFRKKNTVFYFNTSDYSGILNWINDSVQSIRAERFQPTSSKYSCKLCDFKKCCSFCFVQPVMQEGPILMG